MEGSLRFPIKSAITKCIENKAEGALICACGSMLSCFQFSSLTLQFSLDFDAEITHLTCTETGSILLVDIQSNFSYVTREGVLIFTYPLRRQEKLVYIFVSPEESATLPNASSRLHIIFVFDNGEALVVSNFSDLSDSVEPRALTAALAQLNFRKINLETSIQKIQLFRDSSEGSDAIHGVFIDSEGRLRNSRHVEGATELIPYECDAITCIDFTVLPTITNSFLCLDSNSCLRLYPISIHGKNECLAIGFALFSATRIICFDILTPNSDPEYETWVAVVGLINAESQFGICIIIASRGYFNIVSLGLMQESVSPSSGSYHPLHSSLAHTGLSNRVMLSKPQIGSDILHFNTEIQTLAMSFLSSAGVPNPFHDALGLNNSSEALSSSLLELIETTTRTHEFMALLSIIIRCPSARCLEALVPLLTVHHLLHTLIGWLIIIFYALGG